MVDPAGAPLLGEHVVDLFVAQNNLVYRLPSVFEGDVVAVDVGRQEDFRVPCEALAGGEVGDQAGSAVGLANIDDGAFLLRQRRAEQAGPTLVDRLLRGSGRRGRRPRGAGVG